MTILGAIFDDVLEYLEIKQSKFLKICDKFRSPHLWKRVKKQWRLRHTVNHSGADD